MKKKGLISACLVLVLGLALPLMGGCALTPAEGKVYKIGIVQIATHPALDAAREGFVEEVNVHYDFRNPEGDPSAMATIAQKFTLEKVDLILAVATSMAQACAATTKDIPIVFNCVTEPVAGGFVDSWGKPGSNLRY